MAATSGRWQSLCERLGVQPKQFATLLVVMTVAVGGLGIKYAFAPRSASANAPASAKKKATRTAPVATPAKAAAKTPVAATEAAIRSRETVMTFERSPARDPFKAWDVPEAEPAKSLLSVPVVVETKGPGLLPGIVLKAVVRGELAVFGDQTVRVGDAISLPDGSFASVRAIADRSVTVEFGGREITVGFGALVQPKAPTSGGFR